MRIHKPGGMYFTQLRANGAAVLLEGENDRIDFEARLSAALAECGAEVHAYCWLRNEFLLAVRVKNIALGKIVQKVTGPYARTVLARRGSSGHLFVHPHRALLVEGEPLLLELVRYIHRAPLRTRHCTDLSRFPYSSHRAYLGEERVPWLSMSSVIRACSGLAGNSRLAYRLMMEADEAPDLWSRLRESAVRQRREIDRSTKGLQHHARDDHSWTVEQWVQAVGQRLKIEPSQILSQSRRRELSQARALVALRATEDGASLAEVARYLGRDPSTLISGMERYRERDRVIFPKSPKRPVRPASPRRKRCPAEVAEAQVFAARSRRSA